MLKPIFGNNDRSSMGQFSPWPVGRPERIGHFDRYWQKNVCFQWSAATPGYWK
jgi:hypothetical protein